MAMSGNRRAKIWQFFAFKIIEPWSDLAYKLDGKLPDRVLNLMYPPNWLACKVLGFCWIWGHSAVVDQCMRPEHDFCEWCMKKMPHQAERNKL